MMMLSGFSKVMIGENMKKFFITFLAVCSAMLFVSCNNLIGSGDKSSEYNVELRLFGEGKGAGRTITSYNSYDFDFEEVEWNISFEKIEGSGADQQRIKVNAIREVDSEEGLRRYLFNYGTYVAIAEGNVQEVIQDGQGNAKSVSHNFYGEKQFTVDSSSVSVSVAVGLKKTKEGMGSIESIYVSGNKELLSEVKSASYSENGVKAEITPVSGGESIECSITFVESNNFIIFRYETKDDAVVHTIPSGYYYLSVTYKVRTNDGFIEKNLPLSDTLVEISDNECVNAEINAVDSIKVRNYYATNSDDTTNGNGINSNHKIKLEKLLNNLKDDPTLNYCEECVINMSEVPVFDFEIPEIESKISFSVVIDKNVYFNFNIVNGIIEVIDKTNYVFVFSKPEQMPDSFILSNLDSNSYFDITLKNGATVVSNNCVFYEEINNFNLFISPEYYEDALISGTNLLTFNINKNLQAGEFYPDPKLYLAGEEEPCNNAVFVSDLKKNVDGTSVVSYSIVPALNGKVPSEGNIPKISLKAVVTADADITEIENEAVTEYPSAEDGKITFTVSAIDGDLSNITYYKWYLNDRLVNCSTNEYTYDLKTSTDGYMHDSGINTIRCIAYNNEACSSTYITWTFKPASRMARTDILLWNAAPDEENVVFNNKDESVHTMEDLKVCMQFFDKVENKQSFNTKASYINAVPKNFCFDYLTGDLYLFTNGDSGDVLLKLKKYKKDNNYEEEFSVNVQYLDPNSEISAMAYLDNRIYFTFLNGNNGFYYTDDLSKNKDALNTNYFSDFEYKPKALSSDGKYLYLSSNDDFNYYLNIAKYSLSFTLDDTDNEYKISMKEEASGIIYNSSDNTLGLSISNPGTLQISDIMVINDETIYALLLQVDGYYTIRGGLVKLTVEDSSINVSKIGDKNILGWYSSESETSNPITDTESNPVTDVFYGPRKFIALRPDELVICDEGGYCDGESTVRTTNKVVTVKLDGMTMTSVDVNFTLTGGMSGSFFSRY